LEIQQSDHHPHHTSRKKKNPAFNKDALPNDRQHITGYCVWIEHDVPKGTSHKIHIAENEQQYADDDYDNGCSVSTTGNGRKHKGKVAEEQYRKHQLRRHAERINRIHEYGGKTSKSGKNKKNSRVDYQQSHAPNFVSVVGYSEKNFEDAAVLIILDAENRRIKNQQYAGKKEKRVYERFVDISAFPCVLKHEKAEKYKGSQQKPNKFSGKNNFQIILYDTGNEPYGL